MIRRLRRLAVTHKLETVVVVLSAALLFLFVAPHMLVTIPPGSVGVLWLRFFGGTVSGFHLGDGTKVILPWDKVFVYSVRLQRLDQTVTALSRDGLPVEVLTTISYSLDPALITDLHAAVGPGYAKQLIEPAVTSAVMNAISSNAVDTFFILARSDFENEIAAEVSRSLFRLQLNRRLPGNLIVPGELNIRRVTLPAVVQRAIEEKLAEEQLVQRYNLIIARERLESERKAIEAEGIRRFQEVVSANISDTYLRWRGIDATLRLSQSPNSKVVVIGNGPGSLPLILGGLGDGDRAGQPRSPAGEPERATAPPADPFLPEPYSALAPVLTRDTAPTNPYTAPPMPSERSP